MASTFDQLVADVAVPPLWADFGDSAVVTPPGDGAEAVPLTAIVGEETTERQRAREGREEQIVHQRTFLVLRDPTSVYGGIADPLELSTIAYESQTYVVPRGGITLDATSALLTAHRVDVTEIAASPTFRVGRL